MSEVTGNRSISACYARRRGKARRCAIRYSYGTRFSLPAAALPRRPAPRILTAGRAGEPSPPPTAAKVDNGAIRDGRRLCVRAREKDLIREPTALYPRFLPGLRAPRTIVASLTPSAATEAVLSYMSRAKSMPTRKWCCMKSCHSTVLTNRAVDASNRLLMGGHPSRMQCIRDRLMSPNLMPLCRPASGPPFAGISLTHGWNSRVAANDHPPITIPMCMTGTRAPAGLSGLHGPAAVFALLRPPDGTSQTGATG